MSFLNIFATNDFISIICDGQVTQNKNNILYNNVQKFYSHKDAYLVGATGQYQFCREVIDYCEKAKEDNIELVKYEINQLVNKYYLARDTNGDYIDFCVILAYFTNIGSKLEGLMVKGTEIKQLSPDIPGSITSDPTDIINHSNDIILKNIADSNIGNTEIDPTTVVNVQIQVLKTISNSSSFVNDVCFHQMIHRQK